MNEIQDSMVHTIGLRRKRVNDNKEFDMNHQAIGLTPRERE